jgi:hypothetical protein
MPCKEALEQVKLPAQPYNFTIFLLLRLSPTDHFRGGATSSDRSLGLQTTSYILVQTIAYSFESLSLSRSRWLSPSALSSPSGFPSQSEWVYRHH